MVACTALANPRHSASTSAPVRWTSKMPAGVKGNPEQPARTTRLPAPARMARYVSRNAASHGLDGSAKAGRCCRQACSSEGMPSSFK